MKELDKEKWIKIKRIILVAFVIGAIVFVIVGALFNVYGNHESKDDHAGLPVYGDVRIPDVKMPYGFLYDYWKNATYFSDEYAWYGDDDLKYVYNFSMYLMSEEEYVKLHGLDDLKWYNTSDIYVIGFGFNKSGIIIRNYTRVMKYGSSAPWYYKKDGVWYVANKTIYLVNHTIVIHDGETLNLGGNILMALDLNDSGLIFSRTTPWDANIYFYGDFTKSKVIPFSYDGLQRYLSLCKQNNYSWFTLPNATLNITGWFNDSVFTVDCDNVSIRGMGENIGVYNESGILINYTRSKLDSIIEVNNKCSSKYSVFKLNGSHIMMDGIQIRSENNKTIGINCIGDHTDHITISNIFINLSKYRFKIKDMTWVKGP